jgi:hypothetical protein
MKFKIEQNLKKRIEFVLKQIKRKLKKLNLSNRYKQEKFTSLPIDTLSKLLIFYKLNSCSSQVAMEKEYIVKHLALNQNDFVGIEKLAKSMEKEMEEHFTDLERVIMGMTKEQFAKQQSIKPEIRVDEVLMDSESEQEKEDIIMNDEEWQSDEDINYDAPKEVRKNRRGQRARRLIWEKKYKENAKHLSLPVVVKPKVKKEEPKEKLHPSWEAKKREKEKKEAMVDVKPVKIVFGEEPVTMANNSVNHSAKSSGFNPKGDLLHPSWEAKKREKEKKEQLFSIKPTKIVFGGEEIDRNTSGSASKIISMAKGIKYSTGKGTGSAGKVDEGPLHPSWEAKRRMKEKKELMSNVKATKIVFD